MRTPSVFRSSFHRGGMLPALIAGLAVLALSTPAFANRQITAVGEAYGAHGACSGWNGCVNAATCAAYACQAEGYPGLASYGASGPCTGFADCNLFFDPPPNNGIQYHWGNWCGVNGVTDIVCTGNLCGDGIVQKGEACDDDNANDSDCCHNNCTANVGTGCDDGLYCNGADTCNAAGQCTHAGDPCPSAYCNTCSEASDSCPVNEGAACEGDFDPCTQSICDATGACTHPLVPGGETCEWAVVAASPKASVKTGETSTLDGSVCADKAQVGESSNASGSASFALLGLKGTAAKVKTGALLQFGDFVTAGGCLKGKPDDGGLLGTGSAQICCDAGTVPLAGGGSVNACNTSPLLAECAEAKASVPATQAALDALAVTQAMEAPLVCTAEAPCTITASAALNVIDLPSLRIMSDSTLTIDAGGNFGAVIVLRVAGKVRGDAGSHIVLANGAQESGVLIYATAKGCQLGENSTGSGTLFCPKGKVQLKKGTSWVGAIAGGKKVDLGDSVSLSHVPFYGFAN